MTRATSTAIHLFSRGCQQSACLEARTVIGRLSDYDFPVGVTLTVFVALCCPFREQATMQVAPRTATAQEPATPCTAIGQEGDAWEDCSVAGKDDDTDEEEHMEQPMNQSSSKMKKKTSTWY